MHGRCTKKLCLRHAMLRRCFRVWGGGVCRAGEVVGGADGACIHEQQAPYPR